MSIEWALQDGNESMQDREIVRLGCGEESFLDPMIPRDHSRVDETHTRLSGFERLAFDM